MGTDEICVAGCKSATTGGNYYLYTISKNITNYQ